MIGIMPGQAWQSSRQPLAKAVRKPVQGNHVAGSRLEASTEQTLTQQVCCCAALWWQHLAQSCHTRLHNAWPGRWLVAAKCSVMPSTLTKPWWDLLRAEYLQICLETSAGGLPVLTGMYAVACCHSKHEYTC